MERFAQTHLQLYQQLQDAAYGEEDLLLIDRSYRYAMRIFSGQFRPNNKPFLMHLVGVASILASIRQPPYVVAAGLLHSAYALGLGLKGDRIRPRHRKEFTEILSPQVERLFYAYSNRCWSVRDFSISADDFGSLKIEDQQLYLVKIADIHEEFLDTGHQYQPRKKLLHDEDTSNFWLEDISKLIEELGYKVWAEEIRHAVDASNKQVLPAAIRGNAASSYFLAPGLTNNSLKNRLVRWIRRH